MEPRGDHRAAAPARGNQERRPALRSLPGREASPAPVMPIVAVLTRPPWPVELDSSLASLFGAPRLRSQAWPFTATRYYEPELGCDLQRTLLAFAPRSPAGLAPWKRRTGALELRWSGPRGRCVNLDPGYVSLGGLVLASTKPALHRIYLAEGIYAELTLHYRRRRWESLPWTFPDFRSGRYDGFLSACRSALRESLGADAEQADLGGPSGD